uniref:Putative permease of the major facilitator superfamily protein n=2 Tax=Nyssomyia neivai TaxID=330878 RepID=A0A1L8DEH7_9DIPT
MVEINAYFTRVFRKVPARLNIGFMLFLGCFITYMVRVNMSINILAMVEPRDANDTLPDYGPRYPWNADQQGLLLGAYFWGYMFTSIPGAYLAEYFGPKIVTEIVFVGCAAITALSPLAASGGFGTMYAARFLTGVLSGPLYPCFHNLISRWAPPDEKGKYVASLQGGTLGTIFTWQMIGFLVEAVGWAWGGFYIPTLIILLAICIWFFLTADRPDTHPRITPEEREYIENSLGDNVSHEKRIPPYLKLIKSVPFLTLMVLHYGNLWGLYFLLTATPKFMSEVLGFNMGSTGVLSSLPQIARMLFSFVFGTIGDIIKRRGLLQITVMRKSFCIFSHIVPGLFLIGLCFVNEPYTCVALITLSLGFNGASVLTNLANSQDLAPNFAGTLYGIMNAIGTTSGFLTPLVVAAFTRQENTIENWRYVFMIGAGAYIVPAILFFFFGSGQVQPWNTIERPAKTEEETK